MKFIERNLEDIIFNTDIDALFDRGLALGFNPKLLRQVRFKDGGICDLLGIEREKYIAPIKKNWVKFTIYELKKNIITIDTFGQAVRYAYNLNKYLRERKFSQEYNIDICLIGSDIKGDVKYLPDILFNTGFEHGVDEGTLRAVHLYTYKYQADGIKFTLHNSLTKS